MSHNPYKELEGHAFWKSGVEKSDITFPANIFTPRWKLDDGYKIATMGSCFAQHIANWLRENGFNAPFYETDEFAEKEPMFSANYGNVYTVRQALQLMEEVNGDRTPSEIVWEAGDKFIDALRPNAIKDKFETADEVLAARKPHLEAVMRMVQDFDALIFTLGLTETWEIQSCGTVLPTCPGTLGGTFDPQKYRFINFKYNQIMKDLRSLCELLQKMRGGKPFKLLLTVSPVPLTATASGQHVLVATTYSKAVLRSVASDFVSDNDFAQYFPSFEIINNPAARSDFFESNLRSVRPTAVGNVMNVFSASALINPRALPETPVAATEAFDPECEESLLEEFSKDSDDAQQGISVVCVGNSHLAGFRSAMSDELHRQNKKHPYFFPVNWGKYSWSDFDSNKNLTHFVVKDGYTHLIDGVSITCPDTLILVGLGLAGDGIVRCHGVMSRENSPRLPVKSVVDSGLINFYRPYVDATLKIVRRLDASTPYTKVFWVAQPDMCVDVARHRLGDAFVDSGAYQIHKKAYFTALNEYQSGFKKVRFIFHAESLCDPETGFALNEYCSSVNPLDIHCSSEYYTDAVNRILMPT
jgi:hypothetical protein